MDHPPLSDPEDEGPQGLTSDLAFLSGGGEMGALIRATDWTKTPLGPVKQWPQSLKTTIRIMLDSRYAMWLGWGRELSFFYNDAYRYTLGIKHPWALGKPARAVWAEIWSDIGPRIDHVLSAGEATWDEGCLLFLERSGYSEETYHTFSYSPLYADTGTIGGMLCVVTEETERVVAERRVVCLRDLASSLTTTKTEHEVVDSIERRLTAGRRDLPFTLTYLYSDDGEVRLAAKTGLTAEHPATAIESSSGWPLGDVRSGDAPIIVDDLARRFEWVPPGPWQKSPTHAMLLPIAQRGQAGSVGVFVAGINPHRPLDDAYQGFVHLVAGQITAALANARSYEEERKRAEALAELDRAKTTFFSNVSHELRTPLTLMLGPLEELKAQFGRSTSSLDASQYQQVDLVHRNGLRLLKLVNTLLDFSRIEAGRVQAVYEETDLAAFTADLASVFRSAIEKAGLSLIVECPPLPEPVFVERGMWEKIVLNLLSNAFKFTFEGEIEVSLSPQHSALPRTVMLRVRDTGTGIPDDQLGKIFERFHRVAGAQGRTYESTGIGLSLVQELARLHGGSVSVESVYGKGSTFTVTIPFGTAHLPADRIGIPRRQVSAATGGVPFVEEALRWLPSEERTEDSRLRTELSELDGSALSPQSSALLGSPQPSVLDTDVCRPRVLLADDNADMRNYVRRLLAGQGYEVEAVADGQTALDRVRANPPDLILSDVMMPLLDGFGLLRALRADPITKTIPVILLSARAGEESRVEGLEQGADDYLIKPFSARELLARVETHVKMARLRHRAEEALRRSERDLSDFFDNATVSLHWVGPDGVILRVNQTELDLLGYSREEYLGHHIAEFHVDQSAIHEILTRLTRGEALREYPARLRCKDGSIRDVLINSNVLFESGQFIHTRCFTRDVTEQKQAEEALRRLNDELEHRVAERTQELAQSEDRLRTLATELNLAEQRERKRLATDLHDYLAQLLVLGRITLGQAKRTGLPPHGEEFVKETEEILNTALTYCRTLMAELSPPVLHREGLRSGLLWLGDYMKRQELAVIVEVGQSGDVPLPEDLAVLLFQSVRELLINVAKHGAVKKATVRMTYEKDILQLVVHDENGFDLAAATLADQASPLSSKFGLFSIRERMKALGGSFNMQSAPGQGTTATLTLPLAPMTRSSVLQVDGNGSHTTALARSRTHDTPPGRIHSSRIRVLLVDDHAMMRQGLRAVLDAYADIELVGEAADGEQAVALVDELRPTVVVMDVNMPKQNGIEATADIKRRYPEVVIVGLTVNADKKNQDAMLSAGAALLLTKEAAVEELYEAIMRHVDCAKELGSYH